MTRPRFTLEEARALYARRGEVVTTRTVTTLEDPDGRPLGVAVESSAPATLHLSPRVLGYPVELLTDGTDDE